MTTISPADAVPGTPGRPGLPARPRPQPPSALTASAAFGWRALLKIRHVPEQLFDVIAIPVVFTLMFTYLFGGALAGSTHRYLQFILPGTLVMAVLLVSMYAGVGLNTDISKGLADRFRSLPIWRPAPITGALLGDVARYLLAAGLVAGLGLAIGFRPPGGALAGSPGRYLPFLLPGTLVMAVLLVSMYAGIGLNTDVGKGITGRFRSLPVWRPAPVAGAVLGDVARYLIAAALVTVLGVIMGYRPPGGTAGVLAGIGLLLVFALSLSWAWTALGLLLRTPQAVMSTGTVVLFPLTLASNVFVQPPTMPGWLQAFVGVNPVSHLVTAERGLLGGHPAAGQIAWVLLAAAALVAVFAPLTGYLYTRRA